MTPPPAAPTALTFTGERFTPENRGAIWYEHWHRYCAVLPAARGRRVLDAACGEGYGSALLAREAAQVVGVDVGVEAIAHACARYRTPNLAYVQGSVVALPLASASIDLVVSFETIEHLGAQREMLAEFRRVLAPGGVLILSSPNRPVYNEDGEVANEFHVRELDRAELRSLLDADFPAQAWYAQRVAAYSVLWREGGGSGAVRFDVLADDRPAWRDEPAAPMYFVVACAAAGVPLPALPAVSLFDDGALSLWRDYAQTMLRVRQLAWDEIDARRIGEDRLADLVGAVNALSSERQETAALRERMAGMAAELERTRIDFERTQAELAGEAAGHAEARARLAFRETLPGWLRWPLAVAKRRLSARAS